MLLSVYGKTRIVRGCGYIPDERTDKECIRRSGTHDVSATYCACTGELCNGVGAISQNPLILALVAGLSLFMTRQSIGVQNS